MKKVMIALTALGVLAWLPTGTQASPEDDLKAWRAYFMKRFPDVKFDEYSHGLYALPGAEDRRAEWEQVMEFPPYELELEEGRKFWRANGLARCFKNGGRGMAKYYPFWNGKEVRTLELEINHCLTKLGKKPIKDLKKGTMAQVVAYMKSLSHRERMRVRVDPKDPGALAAYEDGKKYFWSRRGQLNFSCAHCHIDNAGKFIGGNILSAGLGHGVGFPAYRSKWGALGTLHRRYTGCHNQVRAAPLAPQSESWRNLEFYEAYMNTGLPIEAPSQRF